MKILLVNQTFYPDVAATAQYLTDLAVHLVRSGHDVTVLTARRSYASPGRLYATQQVYRGIKILRFWSLPMNKQSKFFRTLDALLLNFSFAWRLLWLPRFDQIIALTTPPLIGCFASLCAVWRRSRFIYWMMDINPDQAVRAGWIPQGGLRTRISERMLYGTLKRSDKIVVLDHFMKENILSKGAFSEKIEIIPPWAQEEIIDNIPHDQNSFRAEHHLNGKFVIMYSGNLSICHPVDSILEAADALKGDRSIHFLFVGGGARLQEILAFKEQKALSNITCLSYQERNQLKHSLSAADLHVVTMGDAYTGVVHPSKVYGILATGRPFVFIGSVRSPIGELVQETGIGRQVEQGDLASLIRTIHEVKRFSSVEKNQVAQKSVDLKNARFNQEKLTRKFTELLDHGT